MKPENRKYNEKGGDKLTLNLTGLSNKNKNAEQTNKSSTPTKALKSTQNSAAAALTNQTDHINHFSIGSLNDNGSDRTPSLPFNGATTPTTPATTENVTVTHYSEQRGTIEKISVPSLNIFNAEFKPDSVKTQKLVQTNPFLSLSTTVTTSPKITTTSTTTIMAPSATTNSFNPFIHESLATTMHPIESGPVSIALSNNNGDDNSNHNEEINIITALVSKTNPFKQTAAIDEIDDNDNNKPAFTKRHEQIKNNIDTLKIYKNSNQTDTEHSRLDSEHDENKNNNEVNQISYSRKFTIFLHFAIFCVCCFSISFIICKLFIIKQCYVVFVGLPLYVLYVAYNFCYFIIKTFFLFVSYQFQY